MFLFWFEIARTRCLRKQAKPIFFFFVAVPLPSSYHCTAIPAVILQGGGETHLEKMLEKVERGATVWSYLLQPPLAVSKARTTSYLHLLNLGCPCKKLYNPGFSSCMYKITLFTNKPTQRSGILFPLELCFVLMLSFFSGRLQVSVKIQVKYYCLFQRGKLST